MYQLERREECGAGWYLWVGSRPDSARDLLTLHHVLTGSWNFGSGKLGGGSGGWSFNATTFEYGGGVALNSNRTQANYLVQANTDGSIKMTFFTLQDMKCTTTPATRGELAKTECTVPASGHRSKDRAHHHRSSAHQPRAECGDGNDC